MTLCRCCFISSIPSGFSHTDRPVLLCAECGHHYGRIEATALSHEKMMITFRDSHAVAMERLDNRREALAVELADAKEQVKTLTATIVSDYRERPIGDIQNVVEKAIVDSANLRADAAARSRDRIMGAVFRFDEMHHEVGDDCSCSARITSCEHYNALNFIRSTYYSWENHQIERFAEGKSHGLPYDHPKARNVNRFDWKGLPSTRTQN
jgi:hypothetical protein